MIKIPSAEYDALVAQKQEELRGHKHTQMTESECAAEIKEMTGAVFVQITDDPAGELANGLIGKIESFSLPLKKKRGRPVGSKNRPKGS